MSVFRQASRCCLSMTLMVMVMLMLTLMLMTMMVMRIKMLMIMMITMACLSVVIVPVACAAVLVIAHTLCAVAVMIGVGQCCRLQEVHACMHAGVCVCVRVRLHVCLRTVAIFLYMSRLLMCSNIYTMTYTVCASPQALSCVQHEEGILDQLHAKPRAPEP